MASNSDATTATVVGHPSIRTITVQASSHTKQVGSVPAFGDGKGAATTTSNQPFQEPKPTAISRSVGGSNTNMSTKCASSVPTSGAGSGAATLAPSPSVAPNPAEFSQPMAAPKPAAVSQSMAKRNAWVENATPAKVVPLATPTTLAQVVKPREIYPRSITLQNGDISIQTAPPYPEKTAIFDAGPGVEQAPTETFDTRVSTFSHTPSNFGTHRRNDTEHRTRHNNGTEHRTHHHFNHTKTVTEELTKTKEVTETITTFPQLRTKNSSQPVTLPGSGPTLNSAYTQMTYHHENAVQPTQSAALGSFQPAVPEISRHAVSSQAFQAATTPSIAIFVYGCVAAAMLIVAFAQFIHYIVTGEGEDEPLDEELDTDAVKKIKSWVVIEEKQDREALARIKARAESKTRAKYEKKLAEKDYEESKIVSAEHKLERELADKDWEEIGMEIAKDWEESKEETPKYSTQNMDPIAAYVSISPSAKKVWDKRQAAEFERQSEMLGAQMEKQGEKLGQKEVDEVKEALRRRRVSHALDDQVDPMD